jgi:23S rRNA (pseudouridine1915-N3)-methyltransferase
VPKDCTVIALDVAGQGWSTAELAAQFGVWLGSGRDVALLVGGPDGLAPDCLARAERRWSLSALTFPHALVRILVAEQLYRAWSILNHHPYHRA